ncbi:conserved hypothetical protein [Nitrospina gracilis 3/211]|uniref:Uncharacterized protein n=1 Tax=Nitrospina gracilis (strain 3/211) TaxID=1266370 RepID=M1YYT7_NITG3|nr:MULTISPECIES: hypothetical protein [Nitrospina]MCF8723371.1 hypothetical protein [Nitrospina sp. Nb-3]CCQ90426.1 conserved hypothetical protein [Nitrospina gracilis 3/211]
MVLPGGVWNGGDLDRGFRFHEVTGALELGFEEAVQQERSVPARVTRALAVALESVGGCDADELSVRELSVADRQFLMRHLACHLHSEREWHSALCPSCKAVFDVRLRPSELPIKPPGEGYPFVTVPTRFGQLRFRVPTGADQECIAGLEDETRAVPVLLQRLLVDYQDNPTALEFSGEDVAAIESAIESVAPELVVWVPTECPECKTEMRVEIDPYACLQSGRQGLLREVHRLASAYHWSERDIMEMPRDRRRRYLALVEEARGMMH